MRRVCVFCGSSFGTKPDYAASAEALGRLIAQSGLGLAALPEFMTHGASNLVQVLPELEGPRIDAYFVYPEELRSSKRIQVFRDFLLRKVADYDF